MRAYCWASGDANLLPNKEQRKPWISFPCCCSFLVSSSFLLAASFWFSTCFYRSATYDRSPTNPIFSACNSLSSSCTWSFIAASLAFLFIFCGLHANIAKKSWFGHMSYSLNRSLWIFAFFCWLRNISLYFSLATMKQKIQIPILVMYVSRAIHM